MVPMRAVLGAWLLSLACGAVAFAGGGAGNGQARATRAADPAAVAALARNMYHEAHGEGRLGMLAVGWVTVNRLRDGAFPDTVEGVVGQGCQFAWVCDPAVHPPRPSPAWQAALDLARQLLTAPPPDPTGGSMWFHEIAAGNPGWNDGIIPTVTIGHHQFYARTVRAPPPRPASLTLAGR